MKSRVLFLLCILCAATDAFGDVAASLGGGARYDESEAPQVQPSADFTLLGSADWVPTDTVSLYLDWNAGGSFEPLVNGLSGLFALTVDGSYLVDKFLARLSIASLANPSTTDPFYGAATTELLLSYGGTERSIYLAPRFSFVAETTPSMEASGNLGAALLLFDALLVKPHLEMAMSVPGGVASGWRVGPAVSGDWYPGGPLTLGCELSYTKSVSTAVAPLVVGGAALPLDTWDRYRGEAALSWLIGKGMGASLRLPADYYLMTYDAFDGTTNLGVPTWRLELGPQLDLTIPLSRKADLVLSGTGNLTFSNNSVERQSSFSVTSHIELQLE